MSKRQFLQGLLSTVALPAISLPITNTISMRVLTDYIPDVVSQLDILYGELTIHPKWIAKAYEILNDENYYIQGDL